MAGNTEAARHASVPEAGVAAHHDEDRRAGHAPCGPGSTSARSPGARPALGVGPAPALPRRRVISPMAAASSASRTTTNTQGWRFSALGAKVAASSTFSTMASSTGSAAKRPAGALAMHDVEEVLHGPRYGRRPGGETDDRRRQA